MIAEEGRTLGIYLFTRTGRPLFAAPSGERLPLEPAQVEGVLALAGEFENGADHRVPDVVRARYDQYGVLGLRGERTVIAAVARDAPESVLLPELERFLRRCDKRLRRGGLE